VSTKVLEDLRTARETAGRVLGRRRATTPEQLDECVAIVEESIRFLDRLPTLSREDQRLGASMTSEALAEVRERIKARRKDGGA
jgi:hypothetical protein